MASRFTSSALRSLQRRPVLPSAHIVSAARRNASSSASLPRRFLSTTIILGVSGAFVAYYYDSRSLMHEHIAMPIMRLFDPETGHKAAIKLLSSGKLFRPRDIVEDGAELHTEVRHSRAWLERQFLFQILANGLVVRHENIEPCGNGCWLRQRCGRHRRSLRFGIRLRRGWECHA